MPSTIQGWQARWSRARRVTVVAALVSVGSVAVAAFMPVTILSWCLGVMAGAAAVSALSAARRVREASKELEKRQATREAMLAEQRRVRTVQAEALARLDSIPPPSSGPISSVPSGPISSMPSGPISSMPSHPSSSIPSGPTSSDPTGPLSSPPYAAPVPPDLRRTLPSAPPRAGYDEVRDRPSASGF